MLRLCLLLLLLSVVSSSKSKSKEHHKSSEPDIYADVEVPIIRGYFPTTTADDPNRRGINEPCIVGKRGFRGDTGDDGDRGDQGDQGVPGLFSSDVSVVEELIIREPGAERDLGYSSTLNTYTLESNISSLYTLEIRIAWPETDFEIPAQVVTGYIDGVEIASATVGASGEGRLVLDAYSPYPGDDTANIELFLIWDDAQDAAATALFGTPTSFFTSIRGNVVHKILFDDPLLYPDFDRRDYFAQTLHM